MAYTPTEWENRIVDGEQVIQEGTPLTADNMNKIEQQLKKVSESADTLNEYQKTSEKGVPNGYASLDASGVIPSSQLPSNLKEVKVVANLAERDSLEKFEGLRVLVTDASADTTVISGWAEYVWNGVSFIKTAEMESLDVVLSWGNVTDKPREFKPSVHKHVEADITDLDKYSRLETEQLLEGKSSVNHTHSQLHSHANKVTLDKLTEGHLTQLAGHETRIGDLEASSGQLHTHSNKTALDKLAYSGAKQTVDLIAIEEQASRKYKYSEILETPTIPSKTSQLTNDSSYVQSNSAKITVAPLSSPPSNPQPNDIWIVV